MTARNDPADAPPGADPAAGDARPHAAPEGLFRPEALAYHESHRGPGEPLLLGGVGWAGPAYWALLALVVLGIGLTLVVRVGGDPLIVALLPPLRGLL